MFRSDTLELTKHLSREKTKQLGIFFTPKSIRSYFLNWLEDNNIIPQTILEPSMGSGEFIFDVQDKFPLSSVIGIEIELDFIKTIQHKITNNIQLIHQDFLNYNTSSKFDLIIGNPPYFQVQTKHKKQFRLEYPQLQGKFDICVVFLLKSLSMLKDNGYLMFVLPKTIMSTGSYSLVRSYLNLNYHICDVINFNTKDWLKTSQKTFGLIIRNKKPSANEFLYTFKDEKNNILMPRLFIKEMEVYSSLDTLQSLGYKVSVGEIISTHINTKMTNEPKALLIHNSQLRNFKYNPSVPNQSSRPLYVDTNKYWLTESILVVNRGNGNNGYFQFECALIDIEQFDTPVVCENHIYKISGQNLDRLYRYFQTPLFKRYIELTIVNGMLTKHNILNFPIC